MRQELFEALKAELVGRVKALISIAREERTYSDFASTGYQANCLNRASAIRRNLAELIEYQKTVDWSQASAAYSMSDMGYEMGWLDGQLKKETAFNRLLLAEFKSKLSQRELHIDALHAVIKSGDSHLAKSIVYAWEGE
ncbi:hypothetical protein G3R49_19665 [Shewanella sp. WXL01]|uniref:hypothetical protein n=1 Tax=Shewanella sp. WXL01 TaxID=2709721 RepID=UPI0014386815|nr:hypothetical protein [Shewanella sp. WXL01]NKF52778.1 hypothetical protein [Shewanella sp. WXL01]